MDYDDYNHIVINNDDINLITSYWLSKQFGGKAKWKTLRHNGVMFPPPYKPHGVPVLYKGMSVNLDALAEEYATLYAKYYESDYVNNSVFRRNFWKDWKKVLGKDHIIQDLENCDFKLIYDHLVQIKAEKQPLTMEEQKRKDDEEAKYKIAWVNGVEQAVAGWKVEAPGLFIGRGCNPNMGKIKRRLTPEDFTLNLDKEAPIPPAPEGSKWGKIVHWPDREWLAAFEDVITGKMKYVWLASSSNLRIESDMQKFELARKLKRKIKTIRRENENNLKSDDLKTKQLAVATYMCDRFAIRIGNERGEDSADTVGITTLRCEHVELLDDNKIKLDFLGKDSIRYKHILSVDEQVYKDMKEFVSGKGPKEQVFDKINSNDVNKYLQSFMKGLTAKVFRTYNASNLFQKELRKATLKYANYDQSDKISLLLDEFNKANAKVAILCNHQKNVTKTANKQLDKLNETIKKNKALLRKAKKTGNKDRIAKLQDKIKKLKAKKDMKIELKNIALGTSKTNYIDPRLSIAFLKKNNIPIEKIFSKALMEKFNWAMDVDENYVF